MESRSITDLEALVAIVEAGSLTAAAERLDRSVQAVSRSLQSLEAQTGTHLIARTTRRLSPTPAGGQFYARVKQALCDLSMAHAELSDHARTVVGRLAISAPTLFGPHIVTPVLAAFLERHPKLTAVLQLSDEFVDPADSGADVTVRIGDTPDVRLVARPLGTVRRVTFASTSYLRAHGRPARPEDLARHACVVRTNVVDPNLWHYGQAEGATYAVAVRARIETNSQLATNEAVTQGMGIGRASLWQIRGQLERREVELILEEFEPPPQPLQALWQPTRSLPKRTSLFVDFLAERLRGMTF